MSDISLIRCDMCAAEKRASNHWFVVMWATNGDSLAAMRWERRDECRLFTSTKEFVVLDVCGEGCLGKAASKYAQNQDPSFHGVPGTQRGS
jgi:hypothetical protein